jgi:predicted HTH domain antitoxin
MREETMKYLQVPMPDQLVERYGGETQAAARISRAAVLQLLRDREMTSGEAAEALGITRREVLEAMAEHDIPIANYDPEELAEEMVTLHRLAP